MLDTRQTHQRLCWLGSRVILSPSLPVPPARPHYARLGHSRLRVRHVSRCDQVKARIKIATERCGCNSSVRLQPISLLQGHLDLLGGLASLLRGPIRLLGGPVSFSRGSPMIREVVGRSVLAAGRVGFLVGTMATVPFATWLVTSLLL